MPKYTHIQVRRATATQWSTAGSGNPTLLSGEIGFETDTNKIKVGTGTTWNSTPYLFVTGPTGPTGATGSAGASITLKSSVATFGDLPSVGNSVNDARVVTADGHLYVWDGATWSDGGAFQGPTGAGVPTGGSTGQILIKNSATNYDTIWAASVAPAAHASSHAAGGSDAVTLSNAQITTAVSNKSGNYAIVSTDKNSFIRSTGSAITITLDNVLSVGESIQFIQAGTGQITFAAGTGVTLTSADSFLKTAKQYAGASVVCAASGVYHLIGNLGA